MQIIYGVHAVQSFLKHQSRHVQVLYADEKRKDDRIQAILSLAKNNGVRCQLISKKALDEKADQGRHQGVLLEAADDSANETLDQLLDRLEEPPFILILDGVTDPHNLGACLRTADAAGVHAVIYPRDKSASINSTVRKVACGAAEVMPNYAVTNLARCLEGLKARGIWIMGTAGEAEQDIYASDMRGPIALVMGAEGKGMRRLTREHCDYLIKLPMAGSVSSLNVSVATGVCLFEAVRQRQQH